jgi:acyl-CoA thioesterase
VAFDDDTRLEPLEDGAYAGDVKDTWWVAAGPLGGYVAAIVLRGMTLAVDDPARPVRALTVHFLRAPEPGPVRLEPRVERTGRSLTTVSARLTQGDRLAALAVAAFSAPRAGPELDEVAMPGVAPPHSRDEPPPDPPGFQRPRFTHHLSMQARFGAPPFSGADRAEVGGWIALQERRPVDALTVVTLIDAWFPAPFPRLDGPAFAPTIDLTVHFRAPLPLPDGLLLGRFTSSLTRDAFFEEDGSLWAPDGTLVAQSRQLALLLTPPG